MKKIFVSMILALAMLFACEKEATGPVTEDVDLAGLKSANIEKNEVIENEVLDALHGYFEGLETKLTRELAATDNNRTTPEISNKNDRIYQLVI